MSDNDSNNSGVWWILGISLLGGIIFFFSKDIWPQLDQPVLRCLVAPIAGSVLIIGYFLLYVVLPRATVLIFWKLFLWLTTPRFVFPISVLIAIGTAVCLSFGWIALPIISYLAMIDGIAIGAVGGFIAVRLVRIFKSDSWVLQTAIASPVSIGLAYWTVIKLQPALEIGWTITTIIIVAAFLIRFLYDEHQNTKKVGSSSQPLNASYLSQDMKEQVLRQIRDQMGVTQYNKLVSTIGEDEIINQVLANMRKT